MRQRELGIIVDVRHQVDIGAERIDATGRAIVCPGLFDSQGFSETPELMFVRSKVSTFSKRRPSLEVIGVN